MVTTLSGRVSIHLDADSLSKVCALAYAKGISPGSLIRKWVLERVESASADSSR